MLPSEITGLSNEQAMALEISPDYHETLEQTSYIEVFLKETGSKFGEGIKPRALEPEIRKDVPGCEIALVTGMPHETADKMNYRQGSNPYHARGNCGLVSISNTLNRADIPVSEDSVTKMAIEKGLCHYYPNENPAKNGGTYLESRQQVLRELGIDSEIGRPHGRGGDLDDIVDAIDSGRGVVLSISADLLWEKDTGSPMIGGMFQSNHCIAVTGVARDAATGKVAGIYIADSGRGIPSDACRYISVEKFHEIYTDVYGSGANITKSPIMGGVK